MTTISGHDGFFYIKKTDIPDFFSLRNQLMNIQPKFTKFAIKSFSIWEETTNYVRLPRQLGILKFAKPEMKLADGKDIVLETKLKLYDYQTDAVNKFYESYSNGELGGILNIGCGGGKTLTSFGCLAKLSKKTLYVVDGDANCDMIVEEASNVFLGLKIPILSRIAKNEREKVIKESSIVVVCYKTLMNNFTPETFKDYGLIIMDEVHMYFSEKALKIFNYISKRYILGLTATVTKSNGLDYLMGYYVGPTIFTYKSSYKGAPLVIYKKYHDVTHLSFDKEETYLQIQEKILTDEKYQKMIIGEVVKYHEMGKKILVIGLLRQQLEDYKSQIEAILPDSCALYYAVHNKKDKEFRKKMIAEKPIVLAIRQMGAQSLNIPELNCMILASKYIPKNNGQNTEKIEQLLGRVKRKAHEVSPIVVDVVIKHYYFLNHSKLCDTYYMDNGYEIIESKE